MNNALVLLIETPGTTLSANTLDSELSSELARDISDYLTDLTISELYPANQRYDFYLLGYTAEETIRLQKRIGESFRFLASRGENQLSFLLEAASRLDEYERVIFVKSNTYNLSEESIMEFFNRMEEFDFLFGPSGPAFYLFGIHRDALQFMETLSGLSQHEIDEYESAGTLQGFHLPERSISETLDGLTRLRGKLPPESGLARKIDDIIIQATAVDEKQLFNPKG